MKWIILFVLIFFGSGEASLPTFFLPSEIAKEFDDLAKPDELLSNEELTRVNTIAWKFLKKDPSLSRIDKQLIYPYLANCQRAFALLSQQVSGKAVGSFGPITLGLIHLFLPEARLNDLPTSASENYSKAISEPVLALAKAKLLEQKTVLSKYPIKKGNEYWYPSPDYVGLDFGTLIPWYLESSGQFRSPALPTDEVFWQNQVTQVKQALKNVDKEKREAIHFWAEKADLVEIADNYMQKQNIELGLRLKIRSLLLNTLMDAQAAVFDSKYTYWIKRPFMLDPSIHSLIPTPSHPSYPAAHSSASKAAFVILTAFFPENRNEWERLCNQCSESRIWAGVHFPIDLEEGFKLGEKVGQKAISQNE